MDRISALPNEVLQMIISCRALRGKDVKNFRLAGRTLARLAALRLFEMVTVVPYADHLEAFASFMRQEVTIAGLVHYLEYDVAWRYSRNLGVDEDDSEPDFALSFKEKLGRQALEAEEHSSTELALLVNCMRALPSLRGVRVSEWTSPSISIYSDDHDLVRSYFRKLARPGRDIHLERLGKRYMPEFATKLLLMACCLAGVQLTNLDAGEVSIEQLIEPLPPSVSVKELSMYRAIFGGLNVLRLDFARELCPTNTSIRENLGKMLTSAVSIQELDLGLVQDPHIEYCAAKPQESWLSSIVRESDGRLRNNAIFPRLTKLSLSKMVCQEQELVSLIRSHRHSLKQVCLGHIVLVHSPGDRAAACWVRVLHQLRSIRAIKYVFYGHFNNQSCQWWDVRYVPTLSKSSLKSRLLAWLANDDPTECPLEHAAVRLNEDGDEVLVSEREMDGGDPTWRLEARIAGSPPGEGFVYAYDFGSDTFTEDDDDYE
ncbi:hypothetical protein H2200_001545 [Cladophialophora chaetospira]|uniref:Uncharacterized protein n=1 Tax=Cladophialophora chaetospira TaxID=386627 RepID=A0AA38XLV6_9EURO|nr:hypothetical protein H2200_001545 [Cladophialophora chaetospira]